MRQELEDAVNLIKKESKSLIHEFVDREGCSYEVN